MALRVEAVATRSPLQLNRSLDFRRTYYRSRDWRRCRDTQHRHQGHASDFSQRRHRLRVVGGFNENSRSMGSGSQPFMTLGLQPAAGLKDIKSAYRTLAIQVSQLQLVPPLYPSSPVLLSLCTLTHYLPWNGAPARAVPSGFAGPLAAREPLSGMQWLTAVFCLPLSSGMDLQYHPDLNSSPDATEKFLELKEAYEVRSSLWAWSCVHQASTLNHL